MRDRKENICVSRDENNLKQWAACVYKEKVIPQSMTAFPFAKFKNSG